MMMSDGGIGLYEFTVDDGVYFFVLAERDVCDSQWWFAHTVNDLASRAEAIRSAEAAYAMTEDADDEEMVTTELLLDLILLVSQSAYSASAVMA
jgi:hypothetical protein